MSWIRRYRAQDLYIPELFLLNTEGEKVEVRGRKTVECLNVVTEVLKPTDHCILIPSRRWNPWLALSEAIWILSGRNDVAALAPYNSHISDYSDDGVTLYGAYGARIYRQIDDVIERLRKDPSDRRAVLQIWDYRIGDLLAETKDPPCNNLIYFKLRHNKLHMTVMCRSNDIHYGLFAVNLPTFGILQEYIAARLRVDVGTQTHLSNSLHYYTDDARVNAITDRMITAAATQDISYPEHGLLFNPSDFSDSITHQDIVEACYEVLDGTMNTLPMGYTYLDGLKFASKFLKAYRNKGAHPEWPKHYADWGAAADMFFSKEV